MKNILRKQTSEANEPCKEAKEMKRIMWQTGECKVWRKVREDKSVKVERERGGLTQPITIIVPISLY